MSTNPHNSNTEAPVKPPPMPDYSYCNMTPFFAVDGRVLPSTPYFSQMSPVPVGFSYSPYMQAPEGDHSLPAMGSVRTIPIAPQIQPSYPVPLSSRNVLDPAYPDYYSPVMQSSVQGQAFHIMHPLISKPLSMDPIYFMSVPFPNYIMFAPKQPSCPPGEQKNVAGAALPKEEKEAIKTEPKRENQIEEKPLNPTLSNTTAKLLPAAIESDTLSDLHTKEFLEVSPFEGSISPPFQSISR